MDNEIYTEEGQFDEGAYDNVDSPNPEPAVSPEPSHEESLTLAELEAALGKKFPNKEKAIKALKDTNSYVGAKKDKLKEEVLAELGDQFISANRYNEDMFYARNTEYSGLRDVINAMAKANNMTPQEVVETDTFKKVHESVTGYEKVQKTKTVLQSNPRIAASSNSLQQAHEAMQGGNAEVAANLAAKAVREAFEL